MAEGTTPQRVLLCGTGSVATVKLPKLALALAKRGYEVRLVLTQRARVFFEDGAAECYDAEAWAAFRAAEPPFRVLTDEDEWGGFSRVGQDEVLHVALRRWADLMLVAPLSANTLAKLAGGLCDNLLTCVARAWDVRKPLLVAPAMNTHMWTHPFTARHCASLREDLGYGYVPPVEKLLACGDRGQGAMAEVETLVEAVAAALAETDKRTCTVDGSGGGDASTCTCTE
jgi:phosphopantothenoylcysteine decarboxylase